MIMHAYFPVFLYWKRRVFSDAPELFSVPTKKSLQQQPQCDVHPWVSCYKERYPCLSSAPIIWDVGSCKSHISCFQTFREILKHQWPKHYSSWWKMEKTVWKRCKEEKQAGLQGASCCGLSWHTDLLGLLKSPFGCKDDVWPNMLSPSIPKPDTMGVWDRRN